MDSTCRGLVTMKTVMNFPTGLPVKVAGASDLALYVPYTGATANLNLGTRSLTVGTLNVASGALTVDAKGNLITTLPFQPKNAFGANRIYIGDIHNALYQSDKRFTVTHSNFYKYRSATASANTDMATLFNGGFETTNMETKATETSTIEIDLRDKAEFSTNGITYGQGFLIVSFYHTNPPSSITAEFMNRDSTWATATEVVDVSTSSALRYYRITVPASVATYLCKIKLTVVAGADPSNLNQIELWLTRPSSTPLSATEKFNAQKLYTKWSWMDSSNVEKAYIDATGTIKATGYKSSDNTDGASTTTGGLTFKNGLYTSGTATGGNPFDQDLNTDDDVEFNSVETTDIKTNSIENIDAQMEIISDQGVIFYSPSEPLKFGQSDSQSSSKVYGLQWYLSSQWEINFFDGSADNSVFYMDDGVCQMNFTGGGGVEIGNGMSMYANSDVSIDGKLDLFGGVDPPYVLYDSETRTSIIERIRKEIPPSKSNGIVTFYNSELNRMEYIKPATGEIMVQKADKDGIIGFHVVETIDDGKPCYNTNVKTEYRWDSFLGKVREVQKTIYDKASLPEDKEVNKDTGEVESKVEVAK